MKVLYFTNDSNLYGSNKSMVEIISSLMKKKSDFKPFVLIPKHGDIEDLLREKKIPYRIIRYFNSIEMIHKNEKLKSFVKVFGNFLYRGKIIRFVKQQSPDLIVSNNSAVSIGALIAQKLKIKNVWHIREYLEEDHELQFIQKNKSYQLLNHSNAIIYVSYAVKDKYRNIITEPPLQKVLHNGLDIEKYDNLKTKPYNETIQILISGSINYTKGQDQAIQAIEILVSRNIKNIHLYIAGTGVCESRLMQYVNEKKLNEYVTFLGFQKNLAAIREKCNIALVCSKNEAYGRVTVESMLAKNLVIGSDKGGTRELIDNEVTGLLYQQGNVSDLADKIEFIINHEKLYLEIVENAYHYAKENLSVDNYVEHVYDVYKRCVKMTYDKEEENNY